MRRRGERERERRGRERERERIIEESKRKSDRMKGRRKRGTKYVKTHRDRRTYKHINKSPNISKRERGEREREREFVILTSSVTILERCIRMYFIKWNMSITFSVLSRSC